VALVTSTAGFPREVEEALEHHPQIRIVSRASSFREAMTDAGTTAPDVVILEGGALSAVCAAETALFRETGLEPETVLTRRQREVLALVARGRTSGEIASILRVTPRTVESHRENIGRKLGTRTVAGFTRFAIAQGLVEED
jgi:DNA-binding NarL/FixJ family response regulator